ncbi:MAG: hypothetical protein GWP15_02780 [Nitrospirae bacterium]|nr:hypothetical protein [Nitrospirota bacterium]
MAKDLKATGFEIVEKPGIFPKMGYAKYKNHRVGIMLVPKIPYLSDKNKILFEISSLPKNQGGGIRTADTVAEIKIALEKVKMRIVEVSNVKDLIDNIAPYTTINLKPGTYNLAEIKEVRSKYVERFDAEENPNNPEYEYHIKNVTGLIIRGPKKGKAEILTKPDYGWVFSVKNSENVTFENLTLGHTTPGTCDGGVLQFNNSKVIRIKNCDLFGCGTVGLGINNVKDFRFDESIIRDCTDGILKMISSSDIRFFKSEFRDNKEFFGFNFAKSERITFDQCLISNNQTLYDDYFLFNDDANSNEQIVVKNSTITGNKGKFMVSGRMTFENTKISGNKFTAIQEP